jgi:hypothetical protein
MGRVQTTMTAVREAYSGLSTTEFDDTVKILTAAHNCLNQNTSISLLYEGISKPLRIKDLNSIVHQRLGDT